MRRRRRGIWGFAPSNCGAAGIVFSHFAPQAGKKYSQPTTTPPHTHTHTTTTTTTTPNSPKRSPHPCSVSHIPVRSQTSRFGSGPSCPSRVPIPTARPTRPNRVCARPEGFSSQSAPAWSPVSRLTPACGGQTAAAGAQSHLRRQGLLRLPPPPPSPASSACPSPFMHNE